LGASRGVNVTGRPQKRLSTLSAETSFRLFGQALINRCRRPIRAEHLQIKLGGGGNLHVSAQSGRCTIDVGNACQSIGGKRKVTKKIKKTAV